MTGFFDEQGFIDEAIAMIQESIPAPGKAIIACSGGVDSMVTATLASKAIGDRLLAIYVDSGLMRKGETDEVEAMMKNMGINYKVAHAADEYFDALKGVEDPEGKRKVIGEKFIRVFERHAREFGATYLLQGTIAPDWIESGDGVRDTIKSHHNVGGLPKDMNMTLVEPLRDLYKDEVRQVARKLGVEASEIMKAVGNGEAVRPWQYFAVLLPSKSVGVQGDRRAYGYTVAIRAVDSIDGMTATFSKLPLEVLNRISVRITDTMKSQVNRVVYDITSKPPATIEWE